jgi:hypothetical protein
VSLTPVYFQRETFDREGLPDSLTPFHAFDLPVAGQANLFNGFRDATQLKGSKRAIEQRRELLLDAQSLLLLLEVAQTYYAVLTAERAAAVLANSLALEERRVRDVGDKLAQGVARELDLQQARAQAAATRVRLTGTRRTIIAGRATLAALIGVPYVKAMLADHYPTPGQVAELAPLLALARQHRYDLQAAHNAVLAARQGVDGAVGQYYPSVSVGALAFLYKQSWPEDSQFAGLLAAHVPLFDAGRIHADVRTAWSRYRRVYWPNPGWPNRWRRRWRLPAPTSAPASSRCGNCARNWPPPTAPFGSPASPMTRGWPPTWMCSMPRTACSPPSSNWRRKATPPRCVISACCG